MKEFFTWVAVILIIAIGIGIYFWAIPYGLMHLINAFTDGHIGFWKTELIWIISITLVSILGPTISFSRNKGGNEE